MLKNVVNILYWFYHKSNKVVYIFLNHAYIANAYVTKKNSDLYNT